MLNENWVEGLTETESSCDSARGSVSIIEDELSHKNFADFNGFKSEFLSTISVSLYNYEFLRIIKLVEEYITDFFRNHPDIKMILLKLNFFNLLSQNKTIFELAEFYNCHISPILNASEKFVNVANYLNCISMNAEIVKSRVYLHKFEEVCKILLIAIDRAVVDFYFHNDWEKYVDPQHTCLKNAQNCPVCIDSHLINSNWGKICVFEEELWIMFLQNKEYFQEKDIVYPSYSITQKESPENDFIYLLENNFLKVDEQLENNLIIDSSKTNSSSSAEFSFYNLKESPKGDELNSTNKTKMKFLVHKKGQSNMGEEISLNDNTHSVYSNNLKKFSKKIKLSFFKDFNFKFGKRENIDKCILRKSRKFLKEKLKKNKLDLSKLNLTVVDKKFWVNFINYNCFPPMSYTDEETGKTFDFKSFNTSYIIWLFSHKGADQIFELYLQESFDSIIEHFVKNYELKDQEEISLLSYYISIFHKFYSSQNNEQTPQMCIQTENISHHSDKTYFENKIDINAKVVIQNYEIHQDMNFCLRPSTTSSIYSIPQNFINNLDKSQDLGNMFACNSFKDEDECMFDD